MADVTKSSITRPTAGTYDRLRTHSSALRSWVRSTASRENIISAVKTLAWVAPLTILIWIYAEREQLYAPDPIAIPIEVSSGDPTRVVTLIRPAEKMVMVGMRGPRSRIDMIVSALSRNEKNETPASIKVVVDGKFTPGQSHDLSAVSELQRDPLFETNNVELTSCQPPILTVFVDTFEEIEVPVEAPASMTNLVLTSVEPAKVRVRAPSKALDRARASGPLVAYADLGNTPELRTPGEHELPSVRVLVPDLETTENVSIIPSSVRANVEVRRADISFMVRTVPINVSGPGFIMKRYRVECEDSVANIRVLGPPNLIEMISNGTVTPVAVLEVAADDAPLGSAASGPTKSKMLRYDLPSGVRVEAEDAQRTIDYKLVERATDQ